MFSIIFSGFQNEHVLKVDSDSEFNSDSKNMQTVNPSLNAKEEFDFKVLHFFYF